MDRAKCIPSTTAQRQCEERRVIDDLKANGCQVGRSNNAQPKPRENPKAYASISYIKGVSERIGRILNREHIKTAFKPLKTLGHVFKKPKDWPTKAQLKGIVNKMSCRTCSFTYIGESKRSWKSRGTEHKPGTNGNVGSAVKQHAQTTGHDIHPNCASSLETGVKTKEKRLFLESLHYFLDKNSVNEKSPFQRGYPSLVFSVRNNAQ